MKFANLSEAFDALNAAVPYVVLRNWDNLPESAQLGPHGDLDLLVEDRDKAVEALHATKCHPEPWRTQYEVPLTDGRYQLTDLRFVGDDYYPLEMERMLLDTREFLEDKGFFVPSDAPCEMLFTSLLYHVSIHKKWAIDKNYIRLLEEMGKGKEGTGWDASVLHDKADQHAGIQAYLRQNGIRFVKPLDRSVGFFIKKHRWSGVTAEVTRTGIDCVQKMFKPNHAECIYRETLALFALDDSTHAPELVSVLSGDIDKHGGIRIGFAGQPLADDNMPADWEKQIKEIGDDLEAAGLVHRDIMPRNLMVKRDVIMLIDFGWCVPKGKENEGIPPDLGGKWRCKDGFDDRYSLAKSIDTILKG